jgi:phosphoribosylformimino-5-aminoimidazole carboxamide ribotide isomerase
VIAIPAIDLREGACVQLVGGDYAAERVRLPDPVEVARRWLECGFRRLHVVDLDAATGRGGNWPLVERLLALPGAAVQVGGGLGADEPLARAVDAGAAFVIAGTRAVEDADWLAAASARHPGRLIVAADTRGREVVTRGWAHRTGLDLLDLVSRWRELPLGGLLVTGVHREGRLAGPDLELIRAAAGAARCPLLASGGIGGIEDLRALARAGAAGAVIGMAIYVGALEPRAVAREFSE